MHSSFFLYSTQVRTPANALAGALLLLSATDLSEEQEELLGVMQSGVQNMTQLISDILVLSRFKAGKFSLAPAPVRLRRDLLNTTHRLISLHQLPRGKDGMLQIGLEIDASVPDWAMLDVQRVQQILLNLLVRA